MAKPHCQGAKLKELTELVCIVWLNTSVHPSSILFFFQSFIYSWGKNTYFLVKRARSYQLTKARKCPLYLPNRPLMTKALKIKEIRFYFGDLLKLFGLFVFFVNENAAFLRASGEFVSGKIKLDVMLKNELFI